MRSSECGMRNSKIWKPDRVMGRVSISNFKLKVRLPFGGQGMRNPKRWIARQGDTEMGTTWKSETTFDKTVSLRSDLC